jgi:hypothetical protein
MLMNTLKLKNSKFLVTSKIVLFQTNVHETAVDSQIDYGILQKLT